MPITELGLYESDEDIDHYEHNAFIHWNTAGAYLRQHNPKDAHEQTLQALSYISAWQSASEEKTYLLQNPVTLPTAGDYYCINSSVAKIIEVKEPKPLLNDNYSKRQDSYIAVQYIQVDGKKVRTYRSWCFESYAKMAAKGNVEPVAYVLKNEESAEVIHEITKLLPFVPIKEGEFLCKNLLRKLAKQVTATLKKRSVANG